MKVIQRLAYYSVLLVAAAGSVCAYAAGPDRASAAQEQEADAPALTDAEVIKIDPDHHKVTLKHGEIKNLHMMPMTMDFRVRDDALFARLKPGSKIRFTASRIDGIFTVLSVEAAQ